MAGLISLGYALGEKGCENLACLYVGNRRKDILQGGKLDNAGDEHVLTDLIVALVQIHICECAEIHTAAGDTVDLTGFLERLITCCKRNGESVEVPLEGSFLFFGGVIGRESAGDGNLVPALCSVEHRMLNTKGEIGCVNTVHPDSSDGGILRLVAFRACAEFVDRSLELLDGLHERAHVKFLSILPGHTEGAGYLIESSGIDLVRFFCLLVFLEGSEVGGEGIIAVSPVVSIDHGVHFLVGEVFLLELLLKAKRSDNSHQAVKEFLHC